MQHCSCQGLRNDQAWAEALAGGSVFESVEWSTRRKIHQSSTSGSARLVHITTHFKSKMLTSSLGKLLQGNQSTCTSADYQTCMPAGYLGCFLRLPSSNPIGWSQHGALQEHSGLLLLLEIGMCTLYHIFVRLFDKDFKDQCCVLDLRFAN